MDVWCVYMCLFCVCAVLYLGSGLATSWSLVQGVLPSVKMIMKLKKRPGPMGAVEPVKKIWLEEIAHKDTSIIVEYVHTRIFQMFSVLFSGFDVHTNPLLQRNPHYTGIRVHRVRKYYPQLKENWSKIISIYLKESIFYGSHPCFCTINHCWQHQQNSILGSYSPRAGTEP
jgi:hypothetical protein